MMSAADVHFLEKQAAVYRCVYEILPADTADDCKGVQKLDKKLTILHSNDIHGAFLPEEKDMVQTGGLAFMSGYVNSVRKKEKNTIFAIAGDMFKGSIIDSEYKGLSTIELMNLLNPDVVTLGNHEVDYGLAHLLFVEKCAKFPIINANLFIKTNHVRLFAPYEIMETDGLKIMFIGIITDEVLASTKSEGIIGSFVDVNEAAHEIGIICDTYKTTDVDYTVLLTHIGLENDKELAELIRPEWGIDLIIGGHTHTLLYKPEYVNGIPIVQAGTGTGQIGRIDITFDCSGKTKIKDFNYQIVPITAESCPENRLISKALNDYKSYTDEKYARVVTTFARELTHPDRYRETELGNLFADVMQDGSSFDIMMLGSGSLRLPKLGPVLHLQDLKEFFPYDDELYMIKVTGRQFRRMVAYVFREDAFAEGAHTEFYQYSKGCRFVWSRSRQEFEEFSLNGKEIAEDDMLKLGLQNYHFNNLPDFFGITLEEVTENMRPRMVATSCCGIYEELLATSSNLDAHVEGRITILE